MILKHKFPSTSNKMRKCFSPTNWLISARNVQVQNIVELLYLLSLLTTNYSLDIEIKFAEKN